MALRVTLSTTISAPPSRQKRIVTGVAGPKRSTRTMRRYRYPRLDSGTTDIELPVTWANLKEDIRRH